MFGCKKFDASTPKEGHGEASSQSCGGIREAATSVRSSIDAGSGSQFLESECLELVQDRARKPKARTCPRLIRPVSL